MRNRIWEIDYFRGIAILLMVVFHTIVDLKDFHCFPVEYLSGFWYYEGKLSAVMFMFLAGLSSTLNRRPIKHGGKVLVAAGLVSVITYFFNPATYVRFGILHLLGVSILVSPLLRQVQASILLAGAGIILVLAHWTEQMSNNTGLLIPVGITPVIFQSIDYYPLTPWFSVFILGLVWGRRVYSTGISKWQTPLKGAGFISRLGRNSLMIYLLHQPLLLAVLYLLLP